MPHPPPHNHAAARRTTTGAGRHASASAGLLRHLLGSLVAVQHTL